MASGPETWWLSSGVKLSFCSHPDCLRTKLVVKAELYLNKAIRCLSARKISPSVHAQEGFVGWKREQTSPHNKCGTYP